MQKLTTQQKAILLLMAFNAELSQSEPKHINQVLTDQGFAATQDQIWDDDGYISMGSLNQHNPPITDAELLKTYKEINDALDVIYNGNDSSGKNLSKIIKSGLQASSSEQIYQILTKIQ